MAVVGIDLGTTFSCVANYNNGRSEIIPDTNGHRLIHSFVYYDPETEEVLVGKIAYDRSTNCLPNGIRDIKRLMGRKFDDAFVTQFRGSQDVSYKIVNSNDMAAVEIDVKGKKIVKLPEEISAEILKYLKKMASEYLGKEVREAVISIPAYFSNAQRTATQRAAKLAGIRVLKLLTEPTAGAIHYMSGKKENSKLLVFDWGGGTLDVSLVQVKNMIFEVQAVYGDTLLGGRNIDTELFNYFYIPVDRHPHRFKQRLLNECILMKEELSVTQKFRKIMDYYDGKDDLILALDLNCFNRIIENILQQAIGIVEHGLLDSGWSITDIDKVVLVGGSTRIRRIRELLKEKLGQCKLKTDLNPDEAVAIGASIQAEVLKNCSEQLEKLKVTEVTPLTLGLFSRGNLMSTVIKKNSSLPATGNTNFITTENNQSGMLFEIYEGERKNTKYNNKLGDFEINGIPLKRAGEVKFKVKFYLDDDGILTVSATENSTGKSNKLIITIGEYRLSERKIKISKLEAEKYKHEDAVFEEFTHQRNDLDRRCKQILYDIKKIKLKSDEESVRKKCNDFLEFSRNLEFTDIELLKIRFKQTYDALESILARNGMLEIAS